jgi:hypothetical protein
MEKSADTAVNTQTETELDARPVYQAPRIRVLDEKDVLSAFQVTVAGISWWVM